MTYHFKFKPEVVRAVGLALGAFMIEAFADPRLATDPRGWAAATGIGVLHVVVVAIMGLYSLPTGKQAQPPAQPVTPPTAPPTGLQGAPQFGTPDVRVGQSGPPVAPYRPAPPVLSEAERLHQQRSASAQKGWATRRAEREAAAPATAAPATKRARRTPNVPPPG